MTTENFFVMIKPDGVKRGLVGEIISRFEKKNFHIMRLTLVTPDKKLISEHYQEHKSKSFFQELVDFTISGPVIAMKLSGNISVARKIVGETVPWKAKSNTIRGDYSCTMPQNLIHCSDSSESAKAELKLWFNE